MAPRGDAGCVPAAAAPVGTAKCRLAGLVWGWLSHPYLWRAFPKVQQDSRAFGFVKVLTAPVHASILSDVNPLPPLGIFFVPQRQQGIARQFMKQLGRVLGEVIYPVSRHAFANK